LFRILKITIVGTEANLTFQKLRLFSKFELQFPAKVNYNTARNFMIYVLQSIFSDSEMNKFFMWKSAC